MFPTATPFSNFIFLSVFLKKVAKLKVGLWFYNSFVAHPLTHSLSLMGSWDLIIKLIV
jgi:hypothetical protein